MSIGAGTGSSPSSTLPAWLGTLLYVPTRSAGCRPFTRRHLLPLKWLTYHPAPDGDETHSSLYPHPNQDSRSSNTRVQSMQILRP
jgi:hypothetical protein